MCFSVRKMTQLKRSEVPGKFIVSQRKDFDEYVISLRMGLKKRRAARAGIE